MPRTYPLHNDKVRGIGLAIDDTNLDPHGEIVEAQSREGLVEVHLEAGGQRSHLRDRRVVIGRGARVQGVVAARPSFRSL